jgi:alpha-tubulin suppressor-like RCC1 family protein
LKLSLPRKCFFHSLFSTNTSVNPISKSKHSEEVLEQFFFSILNYGPLDESLRNRLTLWSKSVTSENIYVPTSDGLHIYWSTLQCIKSHNLLHSSLLEKFYIFLTIFAFHYVLAFDPWLGFVTNGGGTCATSHEKNNTTLSVSNLIPSMTHWFEATTWLEPLLVTLNNIIFSPDQHNLEESKMFFPESIKAMLHIANALFMLYTYGDYTNFSKCLHETFSITSKMPPFSMFSCFSLIALEYLRGSGQEETQKTQMWASYFRYTRRTWPLTPFHIGLPDCCPANLIPSQLPEAWSIMKKRSNAKTGIKENIMLNETLDAMRPAKSISPTFSTEIPHSLLINKTQNDKTELPATSDIAIHLMWNMSSSTSPDLFLWFYSCVISPCLVFLEIQSVSNSLDISPFLLSNYNTFSNCNSEGYLLEQSLSSPLLLKGISQKNFESKKKNINLFLTNKLPSASCYLLGNNSIAGSLGVGYPRHLKHEETLYEIAPEFREENYVSKLSGIDVWYAGNPIPMYFTPKALSVVSGDYHTILLTQKTHEIYAWGCNQYGQCGVPTASNDNKSYRWSTHLHPKKIIIDYMKFDVVSTVLQQKISNWMKNPFTFFVNSEEYNFFFTGTRKSKINAFELTVENEQYNNTGRLDTAIMQPVRVSIVAKKPNDPFVDLYAGATYSIARTASGRLWLWGSTWDGCLARESNRLPSPLDGSKLAKNFLTLCKKKCDKDHHVITKYITSRLHRVRKVAAGMFHVAALDCYGGLWLWGQSEAGQLGFGLTQPNNFALNSPLLHSQAVFLPRRLRVFILNLSLFSKMKLKPGQTTQIFSEPTFTKLRKKIADFLTQLKIDRNYWNTLSPSLISCRIAPKFDSIIFSLTDQFLLDYSELNMSHIFSPSPLIREELQFKLVSCGEAHTISVGVTYHGQNEMQWLLSWGQAKYGQLGIDFDSKNEDQQWNIDIASCFNFSSFTDAVISESDVRPTPCIVNWKDDLDASFNGSIMACASGGCCNAIILDNNMVLVFGLNDFGALCFDEQR